MIKVKLKKGLGVIANGLFELAPGRVIDIPDHAYNDAVMDKVTEVKEPAVSIDSNSSLDPEDKKNFRDELIELKGIGQSIANQILKLAKSKADLVKIDRKILIDKLRDDAVKVLDKYLGR